MPFENLLILEFICKWLPFNYYTRSDEKRKAVGISEIKDGSKVRGLKYIDDVIVQTDGLFSLICRWFFLELKMTQNVRLGFQFKESSSLLPKLLSFCE